MAPYILNTGAMRVVEKNDKGNVTYRKRYKKGDEVDVKHLEDGRLDVLLAAGTLVESEDDLSEAVDAGGLAPVSGPFGAASAHQDGTTPAAPPVEPVQTEAERTGDPDSGSVAANTLTPSNPESQVEPPAPSSDDEDVEEVDEYSDMDYPTLQKTAKARDLNAGGSGDEIRARLREDDATNA